jgi:peptidoglycan-associated lipoprotein
LRIQSAEKEYFMSNSLFRGFVVLAFSLALISGCAKDQVKPDEGVAPAASANKSAETKASGQNAATDQSAADKAAAERAAAEKAAAERAAAEKAAAERAAAEKAAAERAAAERAAAEKAAAEKAAAEAALKTIYFDYDSYVLKKEARESLYNTADYLLKKFKGKVRIEGNCDERGSDEYNLALGEKRAKAAMDYLLTLGVPSDQLSIISYGKERPVDPGNTEESWAKNRRDDIVVVK